MAEEICDAVFALDPDSSPDPHSFGGCFYKKCWDFISLDVQNAIVSSMDLPHGIKSSFVTLIPKVEHSIWVTDYRLIVIGNFIYKIFTKIILDLGASLANFFLQHSSVLS